MSLPTPISVIKKILLTVSIFSFFVFPLGLTTHAQTNQPLSSGVATMIELAEENVSEGDIITFTSEGYKKSTVAYDSHVFGVVVDNPQVVLEVPSSAKSHPIISYGKVYIKVSTANGAIKSGDLITTSEIPGVAQRADTSGYVLGTAMQNYSEQDPEKIGKIMVVLNIGFNSRATTVSSNLIQTLRLALSSPEVSPVNALRYFLAAAIVIIAFIFALGYFGKVSATGVEAIGRNPLASRLIMMSMLFHISLALAIILVGIAIAYLILIL